jgi:hypothetical protein
MTDPRRRDYRDGVIEEFADLEVSLRVQHRLERGLLIDLINRQWAEIKRINRQLDVLREELRRYTARAMEIAA